MEIKNKIVLLTGASGGIGAAFARVLAAGGARLVLVGRNQATLEQLRATLDGDQHALVRADLASGEGRSAVLAACAAGIDLLINTAGVNHFGLLESQSEQQLRDMFELNVIAPVLLTQSLLPLLCEREGTVVNVGSGFGSIGFAGYCGYSASKFALRGFTEALRRELADSGVKVLYLAPRAVDTAMNPAEVVAMNEELGNEVDSPEQVAGELMVLLRGEREARYIGFPERFFVKLNGLFPSLVDSALYKKLPIIRRQAMAVQAKAS